jgi:hypothetical protein
LGRFGENSGRVERMAGEDGRRSIVVLDRGFSASHEACSNYARIPARRQRPNSELWITVLMSLKTVHGGPSAGWRQAPAGRRWRRWRQPKMPDRN